MAGIVKCRYMTSKQHQSSSKKRCVIIGAGPAGLGAGWRLTELGHTNFVIYDRNSYVGGLATSFVDDAGFTWDIGGHVLHSHYPYFDQMFEEVMEGEYFTHQRESWVWMYDRFIPYPFQNNIHRLPTKALRECLEGLYNVAKGNPKKLRTFADWIVASFGTGIAKHFMLPYNRKVWAYPPDKMNYQWVGDRVATIDISRIEQNIKTKRDDISWGPNAVFHFPKKGGTGAIWERVANRFRSRIMLNREVMSIDLKKKKIFLSDGSHDTYDVLFTTIPLDTLVKKQKDIVLPSASKLHHSSVTIVGIGIAGKPPENLLTKCWMYFPENIAPFFRATVFSNYSRFNAPSGSWSLMTEVASSRYVPLPQGDIGVLALEGARKTKLVPKGAKIESLWTFRSEYGYPTPTLLRDRYLSQTLPALEALDVYSRGRFGAWKYEVSNQDHTFMQGVEWVNHMLHEEEEITVHNPARVNGMVKR